MNIDNEEPVATQANPATDALLAEAREEAEQWKDAALRARADLANYRKRMTAETQSSIRYANQALIESLLPILDSFRLGLDAAHNSEDPDQIVDGMEMVLGKFGDFLETQRVSEVTADAGTRFDPALHQAIAEQPDETVRSGHILRVIRPGYLLDDRLIRAADVVVSTGNEN